MPCHDSWCVHRFGKSHSNFILQLIADVLPVVSSNILYELLPRCMHLVCSCLVSIVEHVVVECLAKSTLQCLGGTGVALASSTTTPTSFTVATSTAATASSASSAHCGREEKSLLADVTVGLLQSCRHYGRSLRLLYLPLLRAVSLVLLLSLML